MKPFRTIEISPPDPEGLRYVTVKSAALRGRGDICVFSPFQAAVLTDVPLVILLHGVYGSHWAWAHQGHAHRTLVSLVASEAVPPMVLAMPSDGLWGDGSGYVRHETQDFESWIAKEVPLAVRTVLPSVSEKSNIFISGLSMGGFGALRIGGKFPERFAGISAHSAITEFEQLSKFVEEELNAYNAPPDDRSVLKTFLKNQNKLPPLRFDCGKDDLLIEENRALHRALKERRIRHRYEEFPGGHEWLYWQTHLEDTLRFFGAVVRSGRKRI